MLNSIKTEDQRMTVEIGMDCIMPGIEIANDILYDAWEEFFGNVPQPSISALEAERLGRILYAAFDMTSNAIREYHLMLGHYDLDKFRGIFVSTTDFSDVGISFWTMLPSAFAIDIE